MSFRALHRSVCRRPLQHSDHICLAPFNMNWDGLSSTVIWIAGRPVFMFYARFVTQITLMTWVKGTLVKMENTRHHTWTFWSFNLVIPLPRESEHDSFSAVAEKISMGSKNNYARMLLVCRALRLNQRILRLSEHTPWERALRISPEHAILSSKGMGRGVDEGDFHKCCTLG